MYDNILKAHQQLPLSLLRNRKIFKKEIFRSKNRLQKGKHMKRYDRGFLLSNICHKGL